MIDEIEGEPGAPLSDLPVHWAHVDLAGQIVSWGTSHGTDVFLQPLAPGLTAMVRPEEVNGWGWKREGEEWVLLEEPI